MTDWDGGSESSSDSDTYNGWTRLVQSVQMSISQKQEQARIAREAKEAGKIINPATGEWYFYLLDEEWRELEEKQEAAAAKQQQRLNSQDDSSANGAPVQEQERVVADREYYDLLQVSTNADSNTIKRAYYKVARTCHPDKNPNNPEAHAKFQEIGHAYQVLSHEASRAFYDKHGKKDNADQDAAAQADEVDPFVFFNVMFGSSLVEPYVGELWLASQTDSMLNDKGLKEMMREEEEERRNAENENNDGTIMTDEERQELMTERMRIVREKNDLQQRKRVVKIARVLRSRIETYDPSQPNVFAESCREEAFKIVAGAYGALYCLTIGFALHIAAQEYLGFETTFLGLGGHLARTKQNASGFATNMKLLGAGIRAATAGSRAMREAQEMEERAAAAQQQQAALDEQAQQEQMANTLDESLPAFLEFAWAINKRDIQSTLKSACEKLFDDASVPKEMRTERAQAIEILGHEFHSVGKAAAAESGDQSHLDPDDVKARVAVATMATMAKAQGQEVTEQDQADMMQQAKQMSRDQKTAGSFDFAAY